MAPDDHDTLAADLRATVAARHELDPMYEAALVESFLERVDARVADRVRAEVASKQRWDRAARPKPALQFTLSVVSLLVGVPVTGFVADDGLAVIIAAWGGIVAVNLSFAWSQRRRRRD